MPNSSKPQNKKDIATKGKVDPLTGETSTAENAISYTTYQKRKKVDPLTGKPSTAENAISTTVYQSRKKVDPLTGEPSFAENAISIAVYRGRIKVDPLTGEPSTAKNAISYNAFQGRKKVDPCTGKPSTADDAISYNVYQKRKIRKVCDTIIYQPEIPNNQTETTLNKIPSSMIDPKKSKPKPDEPTQKRKALLSASSSSAKKRKKERQSGAFDKASLAPTLSVTNNPQGFFQQTRPEAILFTANSPIRVQSSEKPFNPEEEKQLPEIKQEEPGWM